MKPPLLFQQYQAAFNAYLRDPEQQVQQSGINTERLGIYREIVFNNFFTSVSACFPVLHSILGKRRFSQLTRCCFNSHHFASPLFADIPSAFVDYVQTLDLAKQDLPSFTAQLAHYEWVELYVAKLPDKMRLTSPGEAVHQASDLAESFLQLAPAHMLLQYDYPVHQLSKKHAKLAASPAYLLVFRKADFDITFIELNAVTYDLLQRINSEQRPVNYHLTRLAQEILPNSPFQTVFEFGLQTLYTLYLQFAFVQNDS
jgi:uncharacterized protein